MKKILGNIYPDNRILLKNISGSLIIKGIAIFVGFISTPLFIKYFNNNSVLGVWYTLLSILLWVFNFDLGIGNGIRNHLTKAIVRKNSVQIREIISSGLFSITIVTIILTTLGWLALTKLNLNDILGIANEIISSEILHKSALLVFLAIMLRFEFSFIGSIYYSLQKAMINNLINLGISLLQLLYVIIFHFENAEIALLNISYAYLFISNLPFLCAGIVVFLTDLKGCHPNHRFINTNSMFSILHIGGIFFICQILALLIANTNEFFISNLFGPKFSADYSFYYKFNSILPFIFIMAMAPIWSMVTKKQEENNYNWIRVTLNRLSIALIILLTIQIIVIPFTQFVMNIWLGHGVLYVKFYDNLSLVLFCFLWAWNAMLSAIVCGLARMKVQMICYIVGLIIKITIIYSFCRYFNHWSLVVWSNVVILIPYCIIQHIDILKYIKNKCHLYSQISHV